MPEANSEQITEITSGEITIASDLSGQEYKPEIPDVVRTVTYAAGLIWGTAATLVTGIAAVWWPDQAQAILATVGAGSSAMAFLAGGLGTVYRPTAGHR